MTPMKETEASWRRLPADIWLKILGLLLDDDTSCAGAAAVSRQWQAVIKPRNFARIKITPARLADFDSMTYRNRHLVRYLWLCLELEECCYPNFRRVTIADHHLISTSFRTLFGNLRSWDSHGNLTLDISIYSPSDMKFETDYLTVEPDIPACEINNNNKWAGKEIRRRCVLDDDLKAHFRSLMSKRRGCGHIEKRQYGEWLAAGFSRRVRPASGMGGEEEYTPMSSVEMEFQLEPGHLIWRRLPSVPVVTSVLLRQQSRRRWHTKRISGLLSRLPRIQEIHYEPWREWLQRRQDLQDDDFMDLVQSLPSTLKNLVLFEIFNQHYVAILRDCPPVRAPSLNLSQAIAQASLNLECLSASYLADASFFFDACDPSMMWPNLRSMALTSQLLRPDTSKKTINALLQKAATAVFGMPKLETLEIWNGRKGVAALLRYQPSRATLTWKATWELDISSSVIQAFEKIGPTHCVGKCDVVKELLDVGLIDPHGDAINVLKHVCTILRPISLQQILTEEKFLQSTT
ncbi:hypothetical protein V2G26_017421 [Clonostachys chloroleuca]